MVGFDRAGALNGDRGRIHAAQHRVPFGRRPQRFALVTDKDWVRRGVAVFGWVSPGEMRVFADGERDQAAAWLAE